MKKKLIEAFKSYYGKFKKHLLKFENRRKNLTVIGALIMVHLLLLVNLRVSYGYYYDTAAFSLINATVGNLYLDEYDYVLQVYLEDSESAVNETKSYHLTDEIPTTGYDYSGYTCLNNSVLIFDDSDFTVTATSGQKDVCFIYFDVVENTELSVKINENKGQIECNDQNNEEIDLTAVIASYVYLDNHEE